MQVQELFAFRLLLLPAPKYWLNLSLNDIEGEQWKPIPSYELFYHASTLGRVKSIKRDSKKGCNAVRDRILKQTFRCNGGYLRVDLWKDNLPTTRNVHTLIGATFIDNPDHKPEINHIDAIKYHNWSLNLEWNTRRENGIHAFKMGRFPSQKGEKHYQSKLTSEDVLTIFNTNGNNDSIAVAFNVSRTTIWEIKTGRKWSHLTNKIYKK